MTIELVILSILVGAIASLAILRPAMLFEYPVATAALTFVFLLPQARLIESSGDFDEFQPTLMWQYMILCIVLTFVGFTAGKMRGAGSARNGFAQFSAQYDFKRLFAGACVLGFFGAIATFEMNRMAAALAPGEMWTGPLALFAMLSSLLFFAADIAWIIYLYTGSKPALILAVAGLGLNIPTILFSARRELAFAMAVTILLGYFFVRKKSLSRLVILPLLLIGSVLISQAGQIRAFISNNNSSLIGALREDEITSGKVSYAELGSGVSDVAIATYSNHYVFIAPYLNSLVQLYVPAFLVGHDFKDGLKLSVEDEAAGTGRRVYFGGSTRTGFGDSFQAFHFFGSLTFFAISFFMGRLWTRAKAGDIKYQLYYIAMLPAGLKVFTESTGVFVATLPFVMVAMGSVFAYAKRRKPSAVPALSARPVPASGARVTIDLTGTSTPR